MVEDCIFFCRLVGISPRDLRVAQQSFSVWRDASVFSANSFVPSLGKLGKWSQEVLLITTAVEIECVAMSATSNAHCRDIFATSWPSLMIAVNWSLYASRSCSIKEFNFA